MWLPQKPSGFPIPTSEKIALKLWKNSHSNFCTSDEMDINSSVCLCSQIKWIWRLSQLGGLNPLTFNCQHGKIPETSSTSFSLRPKRASSGLKCLLYKKKLSYAFLNNSLSLLFIILVSAQIGKVLTVVLTTILQGTDAYASRIHLGARWFQCLALVLAGALLNRNLVRAWDSIQSCARAINHSFPRHVRIWSICLSVLSNLIGFTNAAYMAFMGISICVFPGEESLVQKKCMTGGVHVMVILIWTLCSTEFCHVILASLMFVFALIVQSLHKGIAKLLKDALISDSEGQRLQFLRVEEELERLRLLYEKLNEATIHLRRFFGLPALVICLDAILACIFGIYWRILYFEDLDSSMNGLYHYIAVNSQTTYSVISMTLVLTAGQIFVNSSFEAAEVLRKTRLADLNSAARFQVGIFLQSSSGFPTKFSVYSITNIEMPFLAAAATNVITYLLVLMQFRLEQGNCENSQ